MLEILSDVFTYKGRWPRKKFILTNLIVLFILLPVAYFYNKNYPHSELAFAIYMIVFLLLFITTVMTSAKRLQDLSCPGYWILIALSVCYVASSYSFLSYKPLLILYAYLSVAKGTYTENSFGPSLRTPKK